MVHAVYVTTLLKVSLKSTLETQGLTPKQGKEIPDGTLLLRTEKRRFAKGEGQGKEEVTYITHAACICNGYAEGTNLKLTGSRRMEVRVQLQSQ